ncbi:MAG: InlB B-repeat-containing protein [Treponema sp.]|nr:InlB B-repeat-containing protein [Treponema sp.]
MSKRFLFVSFVAALTALSGCDIPDPYMEMYNQLNRSKLKGPGYCSVTWHFNSGTPAQGSIYPQQVKKGTVLDSPSPNPTKDGHIFGGWYSDAGFNTEYNFSVPVTKNITLYAYWAEYGNGTEGAPFIVHDTPTLQKVGSGIADWTLSAHYKMIANITLELPPVNGTNWTRIGYGEPFTGTFDGNGKTITGLRIDVSSDTQGMFGVIGPNGVVKNLGLVNCSVSGYQSVGGVVGQNMGKIENCYTTGTVKGTSSIGGVAGTNESGTIQNCYATGSVSGTNYVGGIAGMNNGTIKNCYATGNVSGSSTVGGIVGQNGGTIQDCYATCRVDGSGDNVGGVVGYNDSGAEIQNCSATGPVSGSGNYIGGVAGSNGSNGTVQNCYATGNVTSDTGVAGGIAGHNNGGTIQNCYSRGSVEGSQSVGGVAGENSGTVQNCYATGIVSGDSESGGIVGYNIGGTVQNCVALNQSISVISGAIGRVVGFSHNNNEILTNNYAMNDMQLNGTMLNNSIDHASIDGASIIAAQYNSQDWWATRGNWNTTQGSAWNFNEVWVWDTSGRLPKLQNVGVQ